MTRAKYPIDRQPDAIVYTMNSQSIMQSFFNLSCISTIKATVVGLPELLTEFQVYLVIYAGALSGSSRTGVPGVTTPRQQLSIHDYSTPASSHRSLHSIVVN